jgi:tight adherence protein C
MFSSFDLQSLLDLSVTNLMMIGSVVAVGIAAFLLVRTLYPEDLLREVSDRAREARSRREDARSRGYVPPPPPGRIKALGGALVEKIGNYNEKLVRPRFKERMRRRFIALGRPENRPQDFIALQQLSTLFFGVLGLLLFNAIRQPLWYAIAFALFGFVFPHIWLNDQVKKRQRLIARALPYNIDLLTLSVEAGLDFQAAIGTVVEKGQPGPLIEELNIMLNEIRLGKTRAESMRNLADRIQLPEVSAFVSNLIQADRMGTSLGKVLRIQCTQMRIARSQRAEKLANEAPVKMLLPLIGCIFPTVFLILFGPIVYRLLHGGY